MKCTRQHFVLSKIVLYGMYFVFPQIPYGIGIAAGIRVGNMLGAGEPGKAKKVSIIAAFFASE